MRCVTSATGSARPAGLHPEEEREERPLGLPTWSDKLVGEVVRLLLEAYYEPTFSDRSHGFPSRPGLPHRVAGGGQHLDRDDLVHRGRHRRLLRSLGSRRDDRDPGGEDPRQPVPAAGAQHARSRIPGGLGLERHAQRCAAGRGRIPGPVQHLSAQAGHVRRDGSDPGIHPRGTQGAQPGLPQVCKTRWRGPAAAATAPRSGQLRQADAQPAQRGSRTIPATGGCGTCGTPTITCSGSPDPRPKPRRSNSAWRQFLRDELKLELSPDKTLITHARTGAAQVPRL